MFALFSKKPKTENETAEPKSGEAEMEEMLSRHKSGYKDKKPLPIIGKIGSAITSAALKASLKAKGAAGLIDSGNIKKRSFRSAKKLGIKALKTIRKENAFTAPVSSHLSAPSAKEWNRIYKRDKLSDYLPYWLYDESSGIYVLKTNRENNNLNVDYALLLEVSPRLSMDGKVATSVVEIITTMPIGMIMQISLIGSANNYARLENWRLDHQARAESPLTNAAISDLADFFTLKHFESVSGSMTARLKNYRLYISLRHNDYNELSATASALKNILAANHFSPEICHPRRLKPVLYEMLNGDIDPSDIPEYIESKQIDRQLIGGETEIAFFDDHLRISKQAHKRAENAKGKYWVALSPQNLPTRAHIFDFGSKMGDKLGAAINTNQISGSFILSATITRQHKKRSNQIKRNHKVNMQLKLPDTLFRRLANIRKESVEILDRIDERGESVFFYDLDLLISGDSIEEMNKNADTVKSYWNKGGAEGSVKLERIPDINHLAFLSALPMGANLEYINGIAGKGFSLFPSQAAQFLPLEADYCGNADNMLFVTRRGALCGIDMFKSDTSFNGFVIATSGAGKSVFLQYLAFCSYARGDRVFVMDIGRSQENLCKAIGGQFLDLDPLRPISFNPFSDIESVEYLMADKDELAYLVSFCYMLGSNLNRAVAESEERYIKEKLNGIILEVIRQKGGKAEVTDVRDMIRDIDPDDPKRRCIDFATQMSSYCIGGIYESFFTGGSQVDFSGNYIVAELQNIENDADIRDPIIMMLIYHLNKSVFKDRSPNRKKLVAVIDEAHKFLGKNPRMDDFVEQAYRRFRKEGGSIIIATQGFDDIYSEGSLSKAGAAIVNNSPWKFFLKQTETSINLLIKSGVFSFSEYEERLLRSIDTKKGEYSEIFLMTQDNLKVPARVVINRFFYYLITSDKQDKRKIQEVADSEKVDIAAAIRILIEREEKQKARI